jgi:hypothetical protein
MEDNLRKQVYDNLNLKDSDELLEIWQTNDHAEWSDEAFEVIREILTKRIGALPPQNEPIFNHEAGGEETDNPFEIADWEAKLLDSESQPDFYDTLEVIEFRRNVDKIAKAVIIIYILYGLLTFPTTSQIMAGYFPSSSDEILRILASVAILALSTGLGIILAYFPLKALANTLRILMEMEFNSRTNK